MRQWLVKKALQRYWRLTRALTLGVQGVVFDDADQVLLVRHGYRPGWHFSGGGVEANETIQVSQERELKEEARVEIASPPRLLGIYANFRSLPSDHIALFVLDEWRQPKVLKPNAEIAEISRFDQSGLHAETVPAVQRRPREIADYSSISPDW